MESSYANNNESFKKFLLDFCANIIVESEENEELPFRLFSKQLTQDELEAETLEWSIRYLSKYNCPHSLSAAISRSVYNAIHNIDVAELEQKETKTDTKDESQEGQNEEGSDIIAEDKDIVLDANKVCCYVIDCVHDVCKKWKDDLPEISLPNHLLYTCTHEIKNTRRKMEDRHITLPDLNTLFELKNKEQQSLFAVFDGHAGVEAAYYAAAHVPYQFIKSESFPRDPASALKAAFKTTDEKFIVKATRERLKSGSTAVLAFIEKNKLHISWLGDSQALLVKNGQAVTVMNPHKPERELTGFTVSRETLFMAKIIDVKGGHKEKTTVDYLCLFLQDERARIQKLGGYVLNMLGIWRVNGMLAVSKAIGDIGQKKFISSDADTTTIDLDGTEDYLILACDGLWDVMDFDGAVKAVYDHVQAVNGDLSSVAKHLVLTAKDLGSSDNITITVVFFKCDISPPQIPLLFNFGVSDSQGNNDSSGNASSDDKGNNSGNGSSNSSNQSDNTSGTHQENQQNDNFIDIDQSAFITNNEFHYHWEINEGGHNPNENVENNTTLLPRKPELIRNEPVFIIESSQEKQNRNELLSPRVDNQHSTISGFRQQYDNISVANLRDLSLDIKPSKCFPKVNIHKTEDLKENIAESESSLNSGYLSNSNKHSEPYYNKSIYSPRRKHHRRRRKDTSHNESVVDTKRSRRHRELSPIVWNFTANTKPSVNNYKLTYSKTSSNTTPRFSIHSHGNLSQTPISVRSSLPDLSGMDKYKSPRATHDFRHVENGVTLAHSIDISDTGPHGSKVDSSYPQLPKIKLQKTQSNSVSKFPTSWKPKKTGRTVSGSMVDVPPTPLQSQRLYPDRQN